MLKEADMYLLGFRDNSFGTLDLTPSKGINLKSLQDSYFWFAQCHLGAVRDK